MESHGVLSVREMVGGIFRFWDDHISADGAWWILALDAVFLIPAIFAVFFFPATVLIGVGVAAVLTLGALVLRRAVRGGSAAR
ncbi:MAG: hypothetical protein A3F70_15030 [Acidobacteria bacterium RIFCSPLOWO2_12_FULL_67_14]|nr:MAG: hypothetical protein A3F70_15030 [Acidobacteria bacterium RIFCSPLOWO2_12_FULL_67_14]